jgi:uncharacterized protein YjiS (DUF1127 family)
MMTTAKLLEMTARQNRSLFERLNARLTANLKRRSIRQSLLNLDDHMLRDVGLTRHAVMSDEF